MKKALVFILAIAVALSCTGCSKSVVTHVTAMSLSDALERGVTAPGGYRECEEDFMLVNLGVPAHILKDYRIILARDDMNANEIGVFRATSRTDAKEVEKYCRRYIDSKVSGWNYDYNPDENVKIENAQIFVMGIYVIYTILTPDDTDYARIVIDNLITVGI